MGTVNIGVQVLLVLFFLVLFFWRGAGARSSPLVLLIIAFFLFALFFATPPGEALLGWLETLGNAAGSAEVVDPQRTTTR